MEEKDLVRKKKDITFVFEICKMIGTDASHLWRSPREKQMGIYRLQKKNCILWGSGAK